MKNYTNKILWVVFLTIFLDMLGIGVIIPIIPLLILKSSQFTIIPTNWTYSEALIMGGWLMASYPFFQFLFSPILGQFSDKYGRRKVLLFSIMGTAISYLMFAYAIYTKNIPLMFIARIFDGATGGNISVAHAVIGDISTPDKRARNFGLVGIALGSGFVFGPFLGGLISNPSVYIGFNSYTPFIFTCLLSVFNVILVFRFLPETLEKATNVSIKLYKPFYNIIRAFSDNDLRNIIPAVFLFNAGFNFFTTFWGVILASKFLYNQSQVGGFFAYFGIMVILAQGIVVRRMSGRVTDYKVLRFSIIATGVCIILYYFVPSKHVGFIYAIPPLMTISIALTKSFSGALITRVTNPKIRGEVMGINSSSNALSTTIPAILSGYLASQYLMYPVLIGGVCTILGGLLFVYKFRRQSNELNNKV